MNFDSILIVLHWKQELDHYVSVYYDQTTTVKVTDPVSFWVSQFGQYPSLADVALDILSCPPSSAVVERVFSKAGFATAGRRMNLSGENLEREVMFQTNHTYR